MESFLSEVCDHDDRPSSLIHPQLCQQMAKAAEVVFDASSDSSFYTAKES